MIQHFLAREIGSGRRQPDGRLDAKRPAGVDGLPSGVDWQNYTYGPDGLCLVRMEGKEQHLIDYAAQKGVLYAFPADLSEILKDSTQQDVIEGTCALYGVPCHWLTQGLEWDEILRRLFRTFTLAQRLRGEAKFGLADLLKGASLDTPWADLPPELQVGLSLAADSLTLDKAAIDAGGLSLKEVLFEAGRTFALDPWETVPPSVPGTITDDFERASLGANWTNGPGSLGDVSLYSSSDLGASTTGSDCGAYYSANSWNADQSSEGIFADVSRYSPGVLVRCASDGDAYLFALDDAGVGARDLGRVYRIDNGSTFTKLGADFSITQPTVGMAWKLDIASTTLTCYRAASSIGTRTDSTYSSGSAGIFDYKDSGANGMWESWSGTGEVVAGASPRANRRRSMRARALN